MEAGRRLPEVTTVARARRGFREELLDAPCSRLSIVRFARGPKRSMGRLLGSEKIFFLIRDIDGPTMAGVSVESCQFVAPRSPWGRFGSAVVACKRLHRTRRRLQHTVVRGERACLPGGARVCYRAATLKYLASAND